MTARSTLSDVTGATLIRFERADGVAMNVDAREAERTIGHGSVAFRAMPGDVSGDEVPAYLHAVLRLDPHRYVFDLPASMRTNGARSSGRREGFAFERDIATGKPSGSPIGKVIFLNYDRRFADRDPQDRRDFERLE